ncbi:MAG: histidine phosphatase family protein, partial [Planctomycetes bacterium]|nr:histidine phosphatase family protein [Planctomycetota bacterium]
MASRIIPIPENPYVPAGIHSYLYFVRHGQANDEFQDDYHIDQIRVLGNPLSKRGARQAQAVADRLYGLNFDVMYSSDLLRAFETSQRIAAAQEDTSVDICQEIREVLAHHNALPGHKISDHIRENMDKEI